MAVTNSTFRPRISCRLLAWLGVLGCGLLCLPLCSAHESSEHESNGHTTLAGHGLDHAVPEADLYPATLIPDRIVLNLNSDPARSIAVTWRTSYESHHGIGQIAKAEDGPLFGGHARSLQAETTTLLLDLQASAKQSTNYHTVKFTDLEPSTKYVYRVGDGKNWSEWSQFSTASAANDPFTFIYVGDAQNDLKSRWSRVIREAYADAPRAAFALHAGDLINRSNNDAEWGAWFYATSHIHRTIPCLATPGNHEYRNARNAITGKYTVPQLTPHWQPTFAFPQNGPAGLEDSVYWIDYQGTRIISLNSNERLKEQADWLEQVLVDNDNRWVVVTCHHPIYSGAKGRDNSDLRDLWQPIFDRHDVDIVLQGHDHTYARTKLMTHEDNVPSGVTARPTSKGGTMYVVSVSGPKMYTLEKEEYMRSAAEDVQLYQIITIDSNQLRYEARTATGRVYDTFTLQKRDGQSNELIETHQTESQLPQIAPVSEKKPTVRQANNVSFPN